MGEGDGGGGGAGGEAVAEVEAAVSKHIHFLLYVTIFHSLGLPIFILQPVPIPIFYY